jgi:hypothetical protein
MNLGARATSRQGAPNERAAYRSGFEEGALCARYAVTEGHRQIKPLDLAAMSVKQLEFLLGAVEFHLGEKGWERSISDRLAPASHGSPPRRGL